MSITGRRGVSQASISNYHRGKEKPNKQFCHILTKYIQSIRKDGFIYPDDFQKLLEEIKTQDNDTYDSLYSLLESTSKTSSSTTFYIRFEWSLELLFFIPAGKMLNKE